ncbi:MAG: hypothetical protein QMD65_02065 [Patescibacteria group bacterium]|nr:hypothetical protein [Patescibacteria group bacterium]
MNRSPSIKQRKAARKLRDVFEQNLYMEGGEILEEVGYKESITKNPQMVFRSEGFQLALKELGFSIEAADMVVGKILRTGKDENKLKASDQIYKRLGGYSPEKRQVISINITSEEKAKLDKLLETKEAENENKPGA